MQAANLEQTARPGPLQNVRHKAQAGWYAAQHAASQAGAMLMAWFTAACVKLAFAWGVIAEISRRAWSGLSDAVRGIWLWAVELLQRSWAWIQQVVCRVVPGSGSASAS